MSENNDSWAVVELMGHVTLAGRVTKPGEYGGLWQIDVPDGETFQTQFFGSQSVYRIRMVSEEIARAYVRPKNCYSGYIVEIDYGEEALNRLKCHECGLNTAEKTRKSVDTDGVYVLRNERRRRRAKLKSGK